jgi:hypothetical protein
MQRGDFWWQFRVFLPIVTVIVVIILLPFYLLNNQAWLFLAVVGLIQGLWLTYWAARRTQTQVIRLRFRDQVVFLAAFQNHLGKLRRVSTRPSDSPDLRTYEISGRLPVRRFTLSLQLNDGVARLTGPLGTLQFFQRKLIEDGVADRYYRTTGIPPPTRW